MTAPLDVNGQPISLVRIYADMVSAGRYDLAAQIAVAIYERGRKEIR